MRVKLCVGETCPLVERGNIFPCLCAASGSVGWLQPEEVISQFILILETRQLFSHKFPSFPWKGEKRKTFLSENI